ncbi:MAG TPA: dihydrolipoamide acetyltransferase family protein [Gammaproteobacteria bacterium]|nr:dihydrolipoamide acetyltransferase family protein [Gammaproteobacteria bacterium]
MNVLMPQLGETVTEGTVSNWHKKVGDKVAADELLFDIETDKVSMEVPSPTSGVITKILVPVGTTVDVGTVLAVIDSGAAESAAAPQVATAAAPAAATPPPAAKAAEAAPPSWYAAMPPSMSSAQPSMGSSGPSAVPAAAVASSASAHHAARSDQLRLSPAVRRLAAEYRLDLGAVPGSGRNGRITRRNVLDFIQSNKAGPQAGAAPAARTAPPVADLAAARSASAAPAARAPAPSPAAGPAPAGAKTLPFTRIRKLTAEHMVRSKATSPHVLQAVEVDFARVDSVRKTVRDAWKAKHGHSITYLPFIAHAVCEALHDFPNLNSSVHGDSLILHEHVNLAIAIDLGAEGLVAPVIKHAEALTVAQLAGAISELSQRSRSGRLKPDDFASGTYTLSNSGTFGTLITAPIINQPQVAILSTDGVRKKPVVIETSEGDAIAIRPVGVLAQSFDHRAVDGAYSAAFLDSVRKLLENGHWVVEV